MNHLMTALSGLALAGVMTTAVSADITVGGKNFTEQQILSNMTTQYLEGLGYDVQNRSGMGSAVVRQETLAENPELADQMNNLSALLDDATMAELNARVDVERQNIEDVSQSFLEENGLL
ncbi:MAG: glycine betaine ABC transporter substrate-binding protein [Halomonas sp.]